MSIAIILAGGLGTRLRSVINDVPKPLAPVNGQPFLFYLLHHLSTQNISRIILSVGYKHELIQSVIGNHFQSIPIEYVIETEPMGTGGAMRLAARHIEEDFFLLNGDTLAELSLSELKQFHQNHHAAISLSLAEIKGQTRYGTVILDQQRVIGFRQKQIQPVSGLINAGTYLISQAVLNQLPPENIPFSLEQFLENSLTKMAVFGLQNTDYFIDIGIPEDYNRAQMEFSNKFNL